MARRKRVELGDSNLVEYYDDAAVADWSSPLLTGYRGPGYYYWNESPPNSKMVGPFEDKEIATIELNVENT